MDKERKLFRRSADRKELEIPLDYYFSCEPQTQQYLSQQTLIHLTRLSANSRPQQNSPVSPLTKFQTVLEAYGTTDLAISRKYQIDPETPGRYRRDVAFCMRFAAEQMETQVDFPENASYRDYEAFLDLLDDKSRKALVLLEEENISEKLVHYPHVAHLLNHFALYQDVSHLFDSLGISFSRRDKLNGHFQSFFGWKDASRLEYEHEGVVALMLLSRQYVFAHYLQTKTDFFGFGDTAGKMSRNIANLFAMSLSRSDFRRESVLTSQRFFTKLLEKEYLEILQLLGQRGSETPEFREFFVQSNSVQRSLIEGNLDPKESYLAFARYHTSPHLITEFMRYVVEGGTYRGFISCLPGTEHYSIDTTDRWVSNGAHFLEAVLVLPHNGEIENYFLNLPSEELAFVSDRLKKELKTLV